MCTIAHSVSDLSVNLITPISSSYLKIGIYTLPKTTQLVYIIRVDNQPTMNKTHTIQTFEKEVAKRYLQNWQITGTPEWKVWVYLKNQSEFTCVPDWAVDALNELAIR